MRPAPGADAPPAPPAATPWSTWVGAELDRVAAAGRWRRLRPLDGPGPATVVAATGQPVVSFASNDYLGLSRHPAVVAAAVAATERAGTGAGASRLVVGSRPEHAALEAELARWRGLPAALCFSSGYAANLGLLGALGGPGVRICSDELNHASIVDGCRLAARAGAEVVVTAHGDVDQVEAALARPGAERSVVVSDSVFSMDGDVAPVAALAEACARHRALLVLDDAHAVLPVPPVPPEVEVARVGTLSKALGSVGGFVAGPRPLVDLLVNRARPFIFSTALPPGDAAAALAALDVARSPEGDALLARLAANVGRVRPGAPSPIVAVVLGGEAEAVAASDALLARGLLVPAIRPPTVPPGTSRLRVALSAAHTDAQVATLVAALAEVGGGR